MSKRVLFISSFQFPEGDAGATRLLMLARALRMQGCDVELCGMGDESVFDGFKCHTLNPYRDNKILNWAMWRLMGERAASFVRSHVDEYDAIVFSFLPARSIKAMGVACRSRGAVFAGDFTEWFEPEQFPKGERDGGHLDHVRLLTQAVDPAVKVIAISSYLQRHFEARGCSVLRVPAVLDIEELAPRDISVRPMGEVRLTYAGSPAKKDALHIVLAAISELSAEERERLRLDLYGVTDSQARGLMRDGEPLPDCVRAHGRVPRSEVVEALHCSDFTVLMRDPSKTFAQAGMPTKVTESLGSGVPVISNLTSDLGEFLSDGANAVVVDGYSASACADALRRVVVLSPVERARMRGESVSTARRLLDYRVYSNQLDRFLFGEKGL